MNFAPLDIAGYNGEPVPNTLITRGGSRHLAIILPGYSYTCMMPVLFYPWKLMLEMGADILRVEYDYTRRELAGVPRDEMAARFAADVVAAVSAGLAAGSYSRVTLVGKSLGTLAMAHILGAVPGLASADCIWLTPLLRNERLRESIMRAGPRSLFAMGTADAEYDGSLLGELRDATGGELMTLQGGDHSLERVGDVMASMEYLMEMTRRIGAFAGAGRDEPTKTERDTATGE